MNSSESRAGGPGTAPEPPAREPAAAAAASPAPASDGAAAAPAASAPGPATAERRSGTPGRRARIRVARVLRACYRAVQWTARRWRRSLQLRVAVATMLVSVVAVFGVGGYLAQRIAQGLFDERRVQVLGEAERGAQEAQVQLDASSASDQSSVKVLVNGLMQLLPGAGSVRDRQVALLRVPDQETVPVIGDYTSGGLSAGIVPEELRAAVRAAPDRQHWQSVALPSTRNRDVPGLVVGSVVTLPVAGRYELYFVFDLSPEQNTLDFIQRVLLVGGLVLVALMVCLVWVVTSLVVHPVRRAGAVAERFASGDFDQRMPVRGEDELAVLGRSFNEMAASLEDKITRMAELSRMQRSFVSDVSHELRTPLTTIRMAEDVLYDARDEFDPTTRRTAELLHTQVERFDSLLADLLEISRFDAGAARLDAAAQDIRPVVQRALDMAVPLARMKHTPLRVHMPGSPAMADVDGRRVERIVRNLLVNAIEHGESEPIDVLVAADADAVAVSVRDRGIGMDRETVERVFDRFWRGDPARARTTGGTGLGLAISREDAHLHGGWLQAWGRPHAGACFRLTLPRRAGHVLTSSPLPLPPSDAKVASLEGPGMLQEITGAIPVVPRPGTAGTTGNAAGDAPAGTGEDS